MSEAPATASVKDAGGIGVVIIGRNEGDRLVRCLDSVRDAAATVVYVDSGSTDGSVDRARTMGAEVVELDVSVPFTAARARNAGVERLASMGSEAACVQFVDGDCEVVDGWLAAAAARLDERDDLAAVCGRRRERYPEASIYNRLCDIEWDTPIGDAKACGGDAMMRRSAFDAVEGFNATIIAGEEPELCFRLRQAGWSIERMDREMTLHDADMHRLSQWWKRAVRAGHAYAEGAWRHGRSDERYKVREVVRAWVWAVVWPVVVLAMAWPTWGVSLLGLLVYPLQAWRVAQGSRRRVGSRGEAWLWGVSCVASHWAHVVGHVRFWSRRLSSKPATILEYKTSAVAR